MSVTFLFTQIYESKILILGQYFIGNFRVIKKITQKLMGLIKFAYKRRNNIEYKYI